MIKILVKNTENKIILSEETDDMNHAERVDQYHTYQGNKVSMVIGA